MLIDGKHAVEAMCANHALRIVPIRQLPIETSSRDPHTGGEVCVRVDPAHAASSEPPNTVVLEGCVSNDGPSFRSCCDALNFFASSESADRQAANLQLSGRPISLPEAIERGRGIFGDLLTADASA